MPAISREEMSRHKPAPKFSRDDVRRIRADFKADMSIRQLCRKWGCARQTMVDCLQAKGAYTGWDD